MTRTIPICGVSPYASRLLCRDGRQPIPNPFGLCRCTTPPKSRFLTLFVSADTNSARICTFHSYLKSPVFNPRLSHSEQVVCFVQMQNEGRYPCSKAKVQRFPILARHSPTRLLRPDPSGPAIGAPLRGGDPDSIGTAFLSPLDCILAKNSVLTPLNCIHTNSTFRKSFGLHTYELRGVGGTRS